MSPARTMPLPSISLATFDNAIQCPSCPLRSVDICTDPSCYFLREASAADSKATYEVHRVLCILDERDAAGVIEERFSVGIAQVAEL